MKTEVLLLHSLLPKYTAPIGLLHISAGHCTSTPSTWHAELLKETQDLYHQHSGCQAVPNLIPYIDFWSVMQDTVHKHRIEDAGDDAERCQRAKQYWPIRRASNKYT